jgi:hypothetical protein
MLGESKTSDCSMSVDPEQRSNDDERVYWNRSSEISQQITPGLFDLQKKKNKSDYHVKGSPRF